MNSNSTKAKAEIEKLVEKSKDWFNLDLDEVIEVLEEAISRSQKEGFVELEIEALRKMPILFAQKGDVNSCYNYWRNAILLSKQLPNKIHLAKVYNGISALFSFWDQSAKAQLYVQNAIDLIDDNFDDAFKNILYSNKGIHAYHQENVDEALIAFEKGRKFGDGSNLNISRYNFHLGLCFLAQKEYQLAKKYLLSIDNYPIEGEEIHVFVKELYLGQLYNETGEFGKAKVILEQMLNMYSDKLINSQLKEFVLKQLSDTYAGLGLYDRAYKAQSEYIELDDAANGRKMLLSYEERNKLAETQKLHSRLEALESTNAELELFASKAAHDLKEPLRTISSFTGLLAYEMKGKLTDEAENYLSLMKKNTGRLSNMLTDMLNFAVIGQSQTIRQVKLISVIEIVKTSLEKLIEEKSAQIILTNNIVFKSDQTLITLLFQNLIANGINYCNRLPEIYISAKQKNDTIIFSVKDNGIGIEDEYLTKIFVPLERLHSQQKYSGTGLGLATCKRIVDELQGTIGVESQPGIGSTFWFSLPLNP